MSSSLKITLAEVAFDFSGSTIDRTFVCRRGLFGRSKRVKSKNATDYWGSRQSIKKVKSYAKSEIDAHRLELELRPRFLRRYHIDDPFEFTRLIELLPHKHISFERINLQKLRDYLRHRGFSDEEIASTCRFVDPCECNTGAALAYLREEVRLSNVRRFLTPLETNRLVREALEIWCPIWGRPRHALGEGSRKKK